MTQNKNDEELGVGSWCEEPKQKPRIEKLRASVFVVIVI